MNKYKKSGRKPETGRKEVERGRGREKLYLSLTFLNFTSFLQFSEIKWQPQSRINNHTHRDNKYGFKAEDQIRKSFSFLQMEDDDNFKWKKTQQTIFIIYGFRRLQKSLRGAVNCRVLWHFLAEFMIRRLHKLFITCCSLWSAENELVI